MARRSPLSIKAALAQIPAPVKGWNARDPLPEMASDYAVVLDNMIPGTGGVSLRGGTATVTTGLPGAVNSLLRYFPASGSQRLFAVSGSGLYDVTAPGPAGVPLVSNLSSDKWQSVSFGTPAGSFTVAASGYDQPMVFDGTAWRAMTLAAPAGYPYPFDPTKLQAPFAFANRLYFIERGSLRVWYLPLYSISATGVDGSGNRVQYGGPAVATTCAQVLDLAALYTRGGALVAMANWTRDGGQGSQNLAVLISSTGQAAIYGGTNPNATDASALYLVGTFSLPPPIGPRCTLNDGADLAVLTVTGAVPLSSVLALSEGQDDQVAFTDAVRGAFRDAYAVGADAFGWELAEYPRGSLNVVNVPSSGGMTRQFVMNKLTGAWCSWSGLPAATFALFNGALVFGTTDGRVCRYDVGSRDDGQPILASVLPAFSPFGTAGKKRFLLARPLFFGPVGYRPPVRVAVDYDRSVPSLEQGKVPSAGTPWGSPWGSPWSTPIKPVNQWQGVRGIAQTASVLVQIASLNPCRLDHIDVQFETGGNF